MRLFTRLIVCAAAAMILSAVLSFLADAWFGEKTSVFGVGHQLLFEARRTEALRARMMMVERSVSAKRDIIDQLVAGRLRLRQAINQFQRANELVEDIDRDLIATYWTPDDPPGVGRQVLAWARQTVSSWPPDKAQRLLAQLEGEYQTLFDGAKPKEEVRARPMYPNSTGRTQMHSAVW